MSLFYSVDYRNKKIVTVARHINASGWILVVKIDKSEVFEKLENMRNIFIAILILTSLIVVLVSVYISRQITSPIISLTTTAKKNR